MRERPTIAQVAQRAAVSASTVSRVMNGGYASPDVRVRVAEVIRELGYSPSPTARNLKRGRTGIIGVVAEMDQGAWCTELLAGIQLGLAQRDFGVVVGSVATDGQFDPSRVRRWFDERRVDAVIFARPGQLEAELIQRALDAGVPTAFVAPIRTFPAGLAVTTEDFGAGEEIAEHLVGLGHQRIAFLRDSAGRAGNDSRERGLERGIVNAGLSRDALLKISADGRGSAAGEAYARDWLLLSHDAPTALVANDEAMALGFMRAVQSAGTVVPREVSVVAFDGLPEPTLCFPALTTARQPTRTMGIEACRRILQKLDEPEASGEDQADAIYPMQLVLRESTSAPHRASRITPALDHRAVG